MANHNRGEKAGNWKGGRTNCHGYIQVRLQPDDFFISMAMSHGNGYKGLHPEKSYVMEHRLVMAKHLNRCLLPWEVVHHKNGIKDDNRLENLELITGKQYHLVDMLSRSLIVSLQKRVTLLEAENIILRKQLEEVKLCLESVGRRQM